MPDKLKKSPVKINKRTHRDVEHEDSTHDLFKGDEKERNRDKMSDLDKTEADSES